jgi:hypothetical protein
MQLETIDSVHLRTQRLNRFLTNLRRNFVNLLNNLTVLYIKVAIKDI